MRERPNRPALAAALVLAQLACESALASELAAHGTMALDLAARSTAIHWPAAFDPQRAELFAHNELILDAACETVWRYIVDAAGWPDWYPNARGVQLLDGAPELAQGVRWRWTTFGFAIESRVHEFVTNERLGWFGRAPGQAPAFYHAWLLLPFKQTRCRVVMEEVGIGPDAAAFRAADEARMHRGHALWLATLKWVSEGR